MHLGDLLPNIFLYSFVLCFGQFSIIANIFYDHTLIYPPDI